MSRSRYIWVITESLDGGPLAAFTVRYECAHWLAKYAEADDVVVYRLQDGHDYPTARPVRLNPISLDPYEGQEEEPE
jgi:hypothetical protein